MNATRFYEAAARSQSHRTPLWAWVRLVARGLVMFWAALAPAAAKTSDTGGLVEGARIIVVSQLGDAGTGSLRAALNQSGPRVIVFEVSGYIDLKSDLPILHGRVTIAGQTAPDRGVVIRGGTLQIRSSEVVIEHIAIYPGSSSDPKIADNRDGITIYGSASRQNWVRNVVLRHLSVGWGVDENIGVNGLVDGIRIERSLIAEGLWRGGHPKGIHSMNLLLGNTVRSVEILGNIFAAGNQRNPRLTQGNVVSMQNNYVYGFGAAGTHIDSSKEVFNAGAIDVVGNVYRPTADSRCGWPIVQIGQGFFDREPRTKVFIDDNIAIEDARSCLKPVSTMPFAAHLAQSRVADGASWKLIPARSVYPDILGLAGARPTRRNPIDARIIAGVAEGTGRMVENETAAGGWPAIAPQQRTLSLPAAANTRLDPVEVAKLQRWLCYARKGLSPEHESCN